jgi:hypothetical protein
LVALSCQSRRGLKVVRRAGVTMVVTKGRGRSSSSRMTARTTSLSSVSRRSKSKKKEAVPFVIGPERLPP